MDAQNQFTLSNNKTSLAVSVSRDIANTFWGVSSCTCQDHKCLRTIQGPSSDQFLAILSWLPRRSSFSEKSMVVLTSSFSGGILLLGEDKNTVSNLKTNSQELAWKVKLCYWFQDQKLNLKINFLTRLLAKQINQGLKTWRTTGGVLQTLI